MASSPTTGFANHENECQFVRNWQVYLGFSVPAESGFVFVPRSGSVVAMSR
jgi:hypothetical protein